ncbi:protein kinase, partial [Spirillospora sp. NPDC049652]
ASGDRAVLTDFGIATAAGDATLTQTGLVMGSPAYIAPERARGRTAGPASDLWSLGVTMYAMAEGRSPFERNEPMAALVAVISEEPDPPTRSGPLTPVIQGLLRKNPDERMDAIEAGRLLDEIVRAPTVDTQRTIAVEFPEATRPTPEQAPPAAEPGRTRVDESAGTSPSPARPTTRPQLPQLPPTLGGVSSRRVLLVVAMIVVIVLAVAGIVWGATHGKDDPKKSPAATTAPPKKTTPATASSTPSRPPSSAPPSSPSVPAGFRTYKDPQGYSLPIPEDWSKPEHRDGGSGWFFYSPDRKTYIQVDRAEEANTSALQDWKDLEPARKHVFKGYQLIGIQPVRSGKPVADPSGERAADWEWTFDGREGRIHALNRGFVMSGHGYAIVLYAPDSQWSKTLSDLQPVYAGFTSER